QFAASGYERTKVCFRFVSFVGLFTIKLSRIPHLLLTCALLFPLPLVFHDFVSNSIILGNWLAQIYLRIKGENDQVGRHGGRIGTQAALALAFAPRVGPPPSDANIKRKVPPLHRSSLCDDLFRSGMTELRRA